jgi:hypothetical protein
LAAVARGLRAAGRMGRLDLTGIKAPRETRRVKPCALEISELFQCIKGEYPTMNERCADKLRALEVCSQSTLALSNQGRHKATTNYHLQRLAREVLVKGVK